MESLKAIRVLIFSCGLLAIFSAERYFSTQISYKIILVSGFVLSVLGLTLPLYFARQVEKINCTSEARCWRYLAGWKLTVLLGVIFYFVHKWQLDKEQVSSTFLLKVLLGSYVSLIVLGIFSGIGLEVAHRRCGVGETAEPRRLLENAARWIGVALLALGFLGLNYGLSKQDKVFDLSYFKATKPGDSTLKIAAAVQQPLKVGVFFSKDSEVLPYVKEYVTEIAKQNQNIELGFFDKDFYPLQAEEFRVSKNGQIVMSRDGRRQRIDIGDQLEGARPKLRVLDRDFQKNLLVLTAEPKNIYFLASHGEMSWAHNKNSPPRSLKAFESVLRSQNLTPRTLSTAFSSIPDDASIVAITGPISSLTPEEVEAIKAFLEKGGKLFLSLDIEFGGEKPEGIDAGEQIALADLLREMGLEFKRDAVVNDREFVSMGRENKLNQLFLFTNVFGSHESVTTLTRNDDKLNVLVFQSGSFALSTSPSGWKTVATILSMKNSFLDKNKNLKFDEASEKRESLPLGVAAEKDFPGGKKAQVIVFADSTMLSDPLMGYGGNQLAALEAIRWLSNRSEMSGAIETEEDVKIQHSKGRELFIFMGSIYAVPILLLGIGFFVNRRKRIRA